MNPFIEITKLGQSIWFDNIRRSMLTSGELKKMIDEDDLRGMTSNPTIFEKAITGSTDYDQQLQALIAAGKTAPEIYEELVLTDIAGAADILRPVYDKTDGGDGFISHEVNPKLAYETAPTIAEADRLFRHLARPNVMIKIPAAQEGLEAIEESIYRGININITMIFGIENYLQVAEAFIRGLERRDAEGKSVDHISSVASFFVSRRPLVTVSRINPRLNIRSEDTARPVHRTAVGKRGTKPVSRNVTTSGYASASEPSRSNPPTNTKKARGFSFLKRVKIAHTIRHPSR